MTESNNRVLPELDTQELSKNTPSFVDKTRNAIANEAKLTVTLPTFDRAKDLAYKLYGGISLGLWTKVAADQPSNELLDSGKEVALTTGFASFMALTGLAAIVIANRIHEKNENDQVWEQVQAEDNLKA